MARFENVADQSADGISVSGEGASKKALIQQHGVWGAHSGEGFDRVESADGVGFLEPVDGDAIWGWRAFLHEVAGNFQHGVEAVAC